MSRILLFVAFIILAESSAFTHALVLETSRPINVEGSFTGADGVRLFINDATFRSLGEYDLVPKLRQLEIPTLIVEGEQSVPTLDSVHAWAEAMPNARLLLIPKSGHFPQVEQPRLFFPAVKNFLNGAWPKEAVITHKAANRFHQS